MQQGSLPANNGAETTLEQHLAALSLPPLSNTGTGATSLTGQTFSFQPNVLKLKVVSLNISNGTCHVILKKDTATYSLNFDSGKWLIGQTTMPGPGLLASANENFSMLTPYKIAGSYGWADSQTLKLKLRYIESVHSETITCKFDGGKLTATVEYSEDFGKRKTVLNGDLMQ
jgi:hypothetical protein